MPVNRPDVARVAVEGNFQGEEWVNVFHFLNTGGAWTEGTLDSLLDTLDDTGSGTLQDIYASMDSNLAVSQLTATTLAAQDPLGMDRGVAWAGSSAGVDLQAFVAVVLRWNTGISSKRRRGRTFLAGVNNGMHVSGDPDHIETTFRSALQTKAETWLATFPGAIGAIPVVFSRTQELATANTGAQPILGATVNPVMAVQLRRRPRT